MKITVTLLIFLTFFTVNTVAQDFTHTVLGFGLEDEPLVIGEVNTVAFSPDGKTLASAGRYIYLWDVEAGTYKAAFNHGSTVNSVAFSPDGKTLASGGDDPRIHLWDVGAATYKASFNHGSTVNSVAFSPDGKTLASGGNDPRIHLWDVDAAAYKASFNHGSTVNSVAFSPDGKTLASGGEDPRIHLWDIDAATHKASFIQTAISFYGTIRRSFVHSVAFSPDGKTLATGGWGTVHLWDVDAATHKAAFNHRSNDNKVHSVAFSPDGKTLASGGQDARVHLWDIDTATHKVTFNHGSPVYSVAFSPDGKTLASGGEDPRIYLWDVDTATHKTTLEIHEGPVYSVAFSPDGKTLASRSGDDHRIYLWDVDASRIKITLPLRDEFPVHSGWFSPVYSVVFSPDGKILATGGWSSGSIPLWDVDTATHKTTLSRPQVSVHGIAFSPDGKTLVSGGQDARIHLWDVDAATHKATLNGYDDPVNGPKTFTRGPGGSVYSVAFSPDGKTLVSGGDDPRIRLWKLPTAHVNVTPYPVMSPTIGEQFTVNLSIVEGEDVGGYQFTVGYDETILRYVESANGDYLSPGSFFVPPVTSKNAVTLSATSLTGTSNGDGVLATVTFEVLEVKESPIALSDLILTDSAGKPFSVLAYSGRIEPTLSSSPTIVDLTPSSVLSPSIGERLPFDIRISDGQNVAGYQVSLEYDIEALRPVLASNGLYLPDAAPTKPLISEGIVTLGASSTAGVGDGDGVLATITFEVLVVQASTVNISGYLTTPNGIRSIPTFKEANVIVGLLGDVNRDGTVNVLDLVLVSSSFGKQVPEGGDPADVNEDGFINVVDLVMVAGAIGAGAAAPSLHPQALAALTAADVQQWLTQAQHVELNDAISQRGIRFLEQLLTALIPKKTALLVNYPNPFNPETWIPYQLAKPSDVTLIIRTVDATVVRTLALGHQPVGIYQDKSRAAYWDGKNEVGESVASGVYFYTLTAGDFTATRKMLIRK